MTVIDGTTYTTNTVLTGNAPEAVAVNAVTNKTYVANGNGGSVTVVDGATNRQPRSRSAIIPSRSR